MADVVFGGVGRKSFLPVFVYLREEQRTKRGLVLLRTDQLNIEKM